MIALFALYDKTKIYKIRDIILIMEWSLIKGRGVEKGKIKGPTLFGIPPPPKDRVKVFALPFLC